MKQVLLFIAVLLSSTFAMADFTPEELAVKQVIEDETRFFVERDFDKWANLWVHAPYIYIGIATPSMNEELRGWNDYSTFMKGVLSQGSMNSDEHYAAKTDYQFIIGRDLAFVTFYENGNASTRVLEKHQGQWKLIHTGVIYTEDYKKNKMHVSTWDSREKLLGSK